jgi:hypothetical protein
VTQDPSENYSSPRAKQRLGTMPTHYELLDLPCSATVDQVRRAYRLKSKLYHPDTTVLTPEVATQKFRELKEAYAVLNNPERRALYDTGQQSTGLEEFVKSKEANVQDIRFRSPASAFLDPKERPLSAGEIFAVFLLGATFIICLVLAIVLGVARGEMVLQTTSPAAAMAALKSKPVTASPPPRISPQQSPSKAQRPKAQWPKTAQKPQRSPNSATDRQSVTKWNG